MRQPAALASAAPATAGPAGTTSAAPVPTDAGRADSGLADSGPAGLAGSGPANAGPTRDPALASRAAAAAGRRAAPDGAAATEWPLPAPADGDGDPGADPLLACLLLLSERLGRPGSAAALTAGLPMAGGLTPALALRAAERAGLAARWLPRPLDQISELTLPCILLLRGRQACLLLARRAGRYLVVLPEMPQGAVEWSAAELGRRYQGQALLARPQLPPDPPRQTAERDAHWFWQPVRAAWPVYGEVLVAAVLINLFALVSPLFVMNVYDRVVPNNALATLWVLALGAITVFGFDFVLRNLRGYFVDSAGKAADIAIAGRIFEQVQGLKLAARPASAGAFASHLREFESLRDFLASATLVAVVDLPFLVLFLAVVWLIGGPVAAVPALAVPLVIVTGLLLQRPLNRIVRRSFHDAARKHGLLVETIHGLETIKSQGAEGQIQGRFEQLVAVTAAAGLRTRCLAAAGVHVAALASNLVTIGVVIVGVQRIGAGLMTVGALVACTIITGRAMAPLAQIAGILTRLHQARAAFTALDALMRLPVERPPGTRFLHRPRLRGAIALREVGFTYPDQKLPALQRLSFSIRAGERVGVIGRIGSGKSTLERLLLGLHEPQHGAVLLDGTDLRQIDPADLRRNIGAVLQDVVLLQGTIRDNIALGAPGADDAAVLRAARIAGVDAFTAGHPQGYDRPVGERGELLSGGQRQAIALARALLQAPPILLLDEPTSAMDNGAEQRVRQGLAAALGTRTLLLISHRSALLGLVDRLLVLEGGELVADGPRDEILAALAAGRIRGRPLGGADA